MSEHVVLHYGEIGTKGANRREFEQRLARNVARLLAPWGAVRVRRESARLVFSLEALPPERREDALRAVARQPGVAWLAVAVRTEPTLAAMCEAAVAAARRGTGSFRIRAKRSVKTLPFDTLEIQRTVGAAVVAATGRPVDLHTADDEIVVEADADVAYVFGEKIRGPDGFPVGVAGKVVALLSGGLDSPVAAWRMMVRGCDVLGLHLWNRSHSGEGSREKVLDLGRALARHQGNFRLVIVPFDGIQREIVAASPADVRMLLYRRAMLRVAVEVKRASKASAIAVGDSVGQVASQTLQNLASVYDGTEPPILGPLHGTGKREIVDTAKRLGTYEISVRPGEDCCGLLVARHPRTTTRVEDIREIETRYDLPALVEQALAERETHDFQALG